MFYVILCLIVVAAAKNQDDDFDPTMIVIDDDVVQKIWPLTCASGESWKNEASTGKKVHCVLQNGHFGDELARFTDDAEILGCKVDRRLPKYMADTFGNNDYANTNPMYQRVKNDCGFCGNKASCCGTKNAEVVADKLTKAHPDLKNIIHPFYFQSFKGEHCTAQSNKPCSFAPLTSAEFDQMAKIQPFTKPIDRANDCNFAQFGFTEWEAAKAHPSFPLVETLFNKFVCSSVQTTKPKYNCVKNQNTKQCMCCCNNNYPVQRFDVWDCVPKMEEKTETACAHL